jgi:hypothetical protein
VLRIRIRDLFDTWIRDGIKIRIRISRGIRIREDPDHISESHLLDPESGMEKFGSWINIPDPQQCGIEWM